MDVVVQRIGSGQYKVVQIIGATQILNVSPTKPTITINDVLNDVQIADLQKGAYVVTTNPYA